MAVALNKGIWVKKADGLAEDFDPVKLSSSLERVGASDLMRDKIIAHIKGELTNGIDTDDIFNHALFLLRKEEKQAAARYSLRRALLQLGPTGFPFEDFVGEVYKSRGYTVESGKIVYGACVEHEVDFIGYKDDSLIMGEVKFHNELGMKTDLKVALYVKARTDDLMHGKFIFGGKERKLTNGILITNTKFTQTAIKYGECVGLPMVGWNYPAKDNLQDLIEGANLHPITCLSSLPGSHKKDLFDKGVVLCRTLKENSELLESIHLSAQEKAGLLEELGMVC